MFKVEKKLNNLDCAALSQSLLPKLLEKKISPCRH